MSYPPNPTISLFNLFRQRQYDLSNYLPRGGIYWLGKGRQAITAAIKALSLPPGSVVLLPSFQCSSAINPFLCCKLRPHFYDLKSDLTIDLQHIEELIVRHRPVLMMIVHYYGFEFRAMNELESLLKRQGVLLLEDCAHALFSRSGKRPLGSHGDASIFSLSKALPIVDGGFLIIRDNRNLDFALEPYAQISSVIGFLKLFSYRIEHLFPISIRTVLRSLPNVDEVVRLWMDSPDLDLVHRVPQELPSLSRKIVLASDPEDIIQRRKANFEAVLQVLTSHKDSPLIPIFSDLSNGVCPLGLPVLVGRNRDELTRALWRRGIPVRPIWDRLPTYLARQRCEGAELLSKQILVLPIHQSLSQQQAVKIGEMTMHIARLLCGKHSNSCVAPQMPRSSCLSN